MVPFYIPQTVHRVLISSHAHQYFLFSGFFFSFLILGTLMVVRQYLIIVLICISQMMLNIISYAYCPFIHLLWRNNYSSPLPIFKLGCLGFLLLFLSFRRILYILDINSLSDMWFAIISSHSESYFLLC